MTFFFLFLLVHIPPATVLRKDTQGHSLTGGSDIVTRKTHTCTAAEAIHPLMHGYPLEMTETLQRLCLSRRKTRLSRRTRALGPPTSTLFSC
ncbi:hypothetical protein F4778DRAFT_712392 [Xylariomycetidae sp. FL2044]|nr:hypothetical protein F4778DRAFT_712392 [Xylariomycetidae sp. FL2044]